MELIAYYEGSDDVIDWLDALLEKEIRYKKLPTGNNSNDFTKLPAYVADILYLDKPDIILSGRVDDVHEKPLFSIEFASCTPQYQHALQRFSRMMASVVSGCPSAIVMPLKKRENSSGGKRLYQRSQALEYGAVRLMDIYRVPAFVFNWPDDDGFLQNEGDTNLPEIESQGIHSLKTLIIKAISAFESLDYIDSLWRLKESRQLLEEVRVRAYSGGPPTIDRPGGGVGAATQSKLDLVPTQDLLENIRDKIPAARRLLDDIPNHITSRENSLVFYPTRVTAHAGDPYVGMIGYYDIAFCRIGRSTRERSSNLIAFTNGVSIREVEESMSNFNSGGCPFPNRVSSSNILKYSYHLRHGCKETKIKPVRIYAELADMIVFDDGVLFNVG